MKISQRLSRFMEEIRWEDATHPSWWVQFIKRQIRLYFYIARETVHNRCLQQAAALTYTTLLSLVPLFAVAFSLFRGFESFKGLETRAEEAIFRTMLAAPLVEGLPSGKRLGETSELLEDLAAGLDVPSEDLLRKADELAAAGNGEDAAALYLEALARGASASRVREGLARVYVGPPKEMLERLKSFTPKVRDSYARAAGLPVRPQEQAEPSKVARSRYKKAEELQQKQDYAGAIEELQLAQAGGYPSHKTRSAAAFLHATLADRLGQKGDYENAATHYQAAADAFLDALVLGAPHIRENQARTFVGEHNLAIRDLGESFLTLGRARYDLALTLQQSAPDAAKDSLASSIGYFRKAISYLESSAEAHTALGDALWAQGSTEEARQQYLKAVERGKEVAARGFSVAAVDYIRRFTDKVGTAGIGLIGSLFLIVTAISLLNTIEKTLNHIWQVKERRRFWTKFTSFCTLIWLGPVLIAASILVQEKLTSEVQAALGETPVLGTLLEVVAAVGRLVLPFATVWLALVALYKFLPHTKVKFRAAAWGACVAAVLIQIARPSFGFYVAGAIKYQRIYGSLALVPIFLLWLWLLWLLVLFGAEVAFTVQNIGLLRFQDKLRRVSKLSIDRYLAVRIVLYVAREFWKSGRPMRVDKLAEILHMPPEEAHDAASRMVKLGLLTPVGEELLEFHPTRDLSRMKVMEVLSVSDRFRGDSRSTEPEDKPYEDRLERVFHSTIAAQEHALENLTFRDLLEACEQDAGREAESGHEGDSSTPTRDVQR